MARPRKIRITRNDVEEYNRLAKNTKAKISRTLKNYGVDISNDISIPKLNDFKDRKEFNAWKDEVRKFTNRANTNYQFKKNEFGVVASVKELNEIKKANKRARKVAKEISKKMEDKPFISGGKQYGTVKDRQQMMGKPNTGGIYVPPIFKFENVRSRRELEDKRKNLTERSEPKFFDKRAEDLKKNYINMIEETFNSDGEELKRKIEEIPSDEFFEMFLMFDELQFEYFYTEEQTSGKIEQLNTIFDKYLSGKVNMDLKGF